MSRSLHPTAPLSFKPLSSFLLGTALALSLNHAQAESARNGLTAFGWAIVAALAGTFVYTLTHWTTLVNAVLPERKVWRNSLIAGFLLSCSLWFLGLSIHSNTWSPLAIVPLTVIPWAVKLWRVVLLKDVFDSVKQRTNSLLILVGCFVFVLPELHEGLAVMANSPKATQTEALSALLSHESPRLFSLLAALGIAAASSLMTAQQRNTSGLIYWSIPCAVASVVLSLFGWATIHIFESKFLVNAFVGTAQSTRIFHAAPAVIFGVIFLALRPRIQILNTLRIGKAQSVWWQQLGVLSGFSLCLILSQRAFMNWYDFVATLTLFVGFAIESKAQPQQQRTYTTLSVVELTESQQAATGA